MIRRMIPLIASTIAIMACSPVLGQGGFGEADANQDNKVDAKELKAYVTEKLPGFDRHSKLFKAIDTDNDQAISEEEFADRMTAVRKVMGRQPETSEQPDKVKKPQPSVRRPALKVGDPAPTFKLKSLDGASETDLAEYKGKKPVVLIFGSYT